MKRRTLLKSALVAPVLLTAAAPSANSVAETEKATHTGEAGTAVSTRQPCSRGIQCGTGWQRLYAPVLQQCSAEGVAVFVVKEKFGGLRIQVGRNQTGPSESLEYAIARGLDLSFAVCEVCGMPARCGALAVSQEIIAVVCERAAMPTRTLNQSILLITGKRMTGWWARRTCE